MRSPVGAGSPTVVAVETRRRLGGNAELEHRLGAILVRMTASERRAFWLGVMLTDGTVDHTRALAAWVRRLEVDLVEVLVDLPPAPDERPAIPRRRRRAPASA